jgi:beta-N-acetylhexosaminidase
MQEIKNKIGQMLLIGFQGVEVKPDDIIARAILAKHIGGVILFDKDLLTHSSERNIQSPAQVKKLTSQLQQYTQQAASFPLFISVDYEGGQVNRLRVEKGFPPTKTAAEIGRLTVSEAREEADRMASTLASLGINMNFAPCVDVNVYPDNPIIGKKDRSFSSDVKKVCEYAKLFSQAYHKKGIVSVYKHFPGHGSSRGDTHTGFVDVTPTWDPSELQPYQQGLSDSMMVMTAHVVHRGLDKAGYPASLSHAITTSLLREQCGFHGVVVTDDLQMKAITDYYSLQETFTRAILAGADILVFGNQLAQLPHDAGHLVNLIYDEVIRGHIPIERIHESYDRIVKVKNKIFPACKQ